jgi:hypothetical protein
MEDHVDRAEEMGEWVLINDGWYEACSGHVANFGG